MGVGHGADERVAVEADAHDGVMVGDLGRHRVDGVGVHRLVHEVDEGETHLTGEGPQQLLLGHSPVGQQELGERCSLRALTGEVVLKLFGAEQCVADEDLAQTAGRGTHGPSHRGFS